MRFQDYLVLTEKARAGSIDVVQLSDEFVQELIFSGEWGGEGS